jgi:hypothetical protein
MIRFIYGTGDLDYDLSYMRKTIDPNLQEIQIITGSFKAFLETKSPETNQSIILKDYDVAFKLLSENDRIEDSHLFSSLMDASEIFVFYFPASPIIPQFKNTYAAHIPIPGIQEKTARFVSILGSNHPLLKKEKLENYPISFIEYAAQLLSINPGQNANSLPEIIEESGNSLILSLNSASEKLFRSLLLIKSNGEVNSNPSSIDLIQNKTGFDRSELKEWIEIAKNRLFLKEDSSGNIQLYSPYLLEYWPLLNDWAEKEKENVNQLFFFRNLAILYQNKKGDLLSETQILSAQNWLKSFHFSTDWADHYIRETDLVTNYIRFSEKHNLALTAAKEKRRKKVLKRTRNVAILIGFAFVLSSFAAVYAVLERNNAIEARNQIDKEKQIALEAKILAEIETQKALIARESESNAKTIAESEKMKAILATESAIREKLNAIQAKEVADREKLLAIQARLEEEKAKLLAEEQSQKAALAIRAETQAKKLATENYLNAERLRQQQIARNEALLAGQFYNEGQYPKGLEIAKEAYDKNIENGGNPFESEFLKSLIIGASYSQLSGIGAPYPIKKIKISPNGEFLVTLSSHGKLTLFNDPYSFQNQRMPLELPIEKIQSFCFVSNNILAWGTQDGEIGLISIRTNRILKREKVAENGIRFIGFNQKLFIGTESAFWVSTPQLDSIALLTFPEYSGKIFPYFEGDKKEILIQKNGHISNYRLHTFFEKKLPDISFKGAISAVSEFLDNQLVFIGDKLGYIHLGDFRQGKIITSLKVHDSGITSIIFLKIKNQDLIITSGLDHKINIIPFNNSSFTFLNPITLSGHSSWVTDLAYDTSNEILVSGGNDQLIRYWIINPDKIK